MGRLHGITEGLELKQYYENRSSVRDVVKKLERKSINQVANEIIDGLTTALKPENKVKATSFSVVPYDALNFYKNYSLSLKGDIEADLLRKAKNIIYSGIENGLSTQNITFGLESIFPTFTSGRLNNIARTETSKAYNAGRLEGFKAPELEGFIKGVQFSAIMDSRVTDICEKRHGLIFAIDDPRLQSNNPPLHYQCRSVLIPVDKYSLIEEDLEDKVGKGWEDVQEPMKGFGGVKDEKGESGAVGKYIKDDISNWREYKESDSSMEKALKDKENAKLLCNKINEKILKDYKHREFGGYVYPGNNDVFYYYLKDIDINCPAFHKDGKIYIRPDLLEVLHKIDIEDLHIITHENFHFVGIYGTRGWKGDLETTEFFEEGLTDLLARKFSFSNFVDVEKFTEGNDEENKKVNQLLHLGNIYDDYCFHMLLQLISHHGQNNNYKVNSVDIYEELKKIRTIDVFTEKELEEKNYNEKLSQARKEKITWQDKFSFTSSTVTQEKFNEVLNNIKKSGILEEEIEVYLEDILQNEKIKKDEKYINLRRGLIKWFLEN